MVQHYAYSRSPDHPYALEMLPLEKNELANLRLDAKTVYYSLFPAVQTAVRFGSDREVFNVTHRSERKSMAMWTTSVLFGTLEEVAALYLDQDGRVPIVLDATHSRRLYELEKPSRDKPLHGVAMRWSLWKPSSKLSNGRDVCFLEYMDAFVDRETGRRVWARSMRSIKHMACPSSQHPKGPVRISMRVSGMIFRETNRPNVLEHVTFFHVDGKGTSTCVVQQAIAANKKAADNLNQVLKIMRQLKTQEVPTWVRSNLGECDRARDCKVCGERISKWTIVKRCRLCGAVLCKKCVEICYHRVDQSGKYHRLCLTCAIYTSRSLSSLSYNRPNRTQTPAVMGERERLLSEMTTDGTCAKPVRVHFSYNRRCTVSFKQTSYPTATARDFEGPSPSISTTSGCRKDPDERLENMSIYSPSLVSTSASRTQWNGAKWKQRSRNGRRFRALTLDLDPRRPEPVDLSYLTDLVTPRAEATRRADI